MKKNVIISALFVFFSIMVMSQTGPNYPIPSYNVPIDSGYAFFQERGNIALLDKTREKQEVDVRIIRRIPGISDCHAHVWIYSLDGVDTLGPYFVQCGETLTVEIDERDWGVLVETDSNVLVDVWIQ
jgi:hypothetical protein